MATTLTRYQPTGSVTRLPEMVDRLFQESFVAPTFFDRFMGGTARPTLPVNLFETSDSYILQASLPGINPEQLDVQVTGREVMIKGHYQITAPENATWIWQGLPSGEFYQTFTLPVDVESDQVQASYEHGILWLTLPKAEHARPKNIKVSIHK